MRLRFRPLVVVHKRACPVSSYVASVAEVAAELGVSPSTIKRAERTALAKLAEALTAGSGPEIVVRLSPFEALMLHGSVARRRYCERLMRKRPYETVEDEPPEGL